MVRLSHSNEPSHFYLAYRFFLLCIIAFFPTQRSLPEVTTYDPNDCLFFLGIFPVGPPRFYPSTILLCIVQMYHYVDV